MTTNVTIPNQVTITLASSIGSVIGVIIANRQGYDKTIGLLVGGIVGTMAGILIANKK